MRQYLFEFLAKDYSPSHVFGAWIEDGYLYVDHVAVTTLSDAVKRADTKGELAIFNLFSHETVRFNRESE